MATRVLIIIFLITVIITINPLILYSESNSIQENKSSNDKDEMPVRNILTGNLLKTLLVISSFTISEATMVVILSIVFHYSIMGIVGVLSSADTMANREVNIALALAILLVLIPSAIFLIISYKRLIITVEVLKNIFKGN